MGYTLPLPDIRFNPASVQLRESLINWFTASDRLESDTIVLFFSGHSDIEHDEFYLLTTETKLSKYLSTAFRLADLGVLYSSLGANAPANLLVLLDTSYAQAGATKILRALNRISSEASGIYLIAACGSKEEAADGVFVPALINAIKDVAPRYSSTSQVYHPAPGSNECHLARFNFSGPIC